MTNFAPGLSRFFEVFWSSLTPGSRSLNNFIIIDTLFVVTVIICLIKCCKIIITRLIRVILLGHDPLHWKIAWSSCSCLLFLSSLVKILQSNGCWFSYHVASRLGIEMFLLDHHLHRRLDRSIYTIVENYRSAINIGQFHIQRQSKGEREGRIEWHAGE